MGHAANKLSRFASAKHVSTICLGLQTCSPYCIGRRILHSGVAPWDIVIRRSERARFY
jgi:hypothetical protein